MTCNWIGIKDKSSIKGGYYCAIAVWFMFNVNELTTMKDATKIIIGKIIVTPNEK